ncbi:trypsin Inhibitor like cysteine rich domain protein [Dictyocaulus viviparus]|uniref:Trypsin Inhibitor like cysteine rich domain protein n=1 Tax=Dictyocaulus viviparus TaxID=29172 RepID=A0A0D8Y2D9_DICVI|nr:trypsin Inhibitor like cysteine rich domain protein [Dictyocaulus viviparus]
MPFVAKMCVMCFLAVAAVNSQYVEANENPCNLVDCTPNTRCVVVDNEAKCLPTNENPPVKSNSCPDNEQFNECGTACEPSCRNPNPQICTLQCVIGCQCKPGLYRNDNGICVSNCRDNVLAPQETCLTKICPPGTQCEQERINCIRAPCPQPLPKCVKIDPYNPCAATTCPVGTECIVKEVQCVKAPCYPVAECSTTSHNDQCGPYETFQICSSNCEPSCSRKNPVCIQSCGSPKCQCSTGFYRDTNNRCVTEAECSTPPQDNQCGQNEVFQSCSSNCEPSCSNRNPVCIQSCGPPKCQCSIGFYRNTSNKCVTEKECSPPPQNNQCGQNEVCNLSCGSPKCQCNTGFYRDVNGRCVKEIECSNPPPNNQFVFSLAVHRNANVPTASTVTQVDGV